MEAVRTWQDAHKPLLLENNGNKIAFIGCNSVDIGRPPTAATNHPGAAPCDYDYMVQEIRQLREPGIYRDHHFSIL